jgi:ubiquinone/menaquinone biosynthesis C-methylase UbiE
MYQYLMSLELAGKKVLVVGCGFGDDALRLAKIGADVHAFDLSSESLALAESSARRESLNITFECMSAERLQYADQFFDCIVARDILHHVDILQTIDEIYRVKKIAQYC